MGEDLPVLVLLPPSEGKAAPRRGAPLDLDALSFPELTATRDRLLHALTRLASNHPAKALGVLGLSPRQTDEVERDAGLETAPTASASRIYTGVLYEALDLATLDATARRRAQRTLVVQSALFGAVRPGDRIPAYRLSGDVSLPGVGPVASFWRDPLAVAMPAAAGRGIVVDLRSGTYAAMWKPSGELASRTVAVRVLQQLPDGTRKVVSHFNKATKGRLVRHWLENGVDARDADELAEACEAAGVTAELGERPKAGAVRRLDVVVTDL
jgi:cytoplasmic iron level regulating protein YaaA (DUF328/UPF0246 family)